MGERRRDVFDADARPRADDPRLFGPGQDRLNAPRPQLDRPVAAVAVHVAGVEVGAEIVRRLERKPRREDVADDEAVGHVVVLFHVVDVAQKVVPLRRVVCDVAVADGGLRDGDAERKPFRNPFVRERRFLHRRLRRPFRPRNPPGIRGRSRERRGGGEGDERGQGESMKGHSRSDSLGFVQNAMR